jgi:hypothetical protein
MKNFSIPLSTDTSLTAVARHGYLAAVGRRKRLPH